jgi:RND family efflux transporter MFP subunit
MKNLKLILAGLVAVAMGAAIAGCSDSNAAGQGEAPLHTVRVAPVGVASVGEQLRAVGLLGPKDQARLSFKVGGYIAAIPIEEGQHVRAGQLLAVLKSTEIDAGLEQSRQGTAKAQRDLERAKALYADGVATLEQVQDSTTAFDVARAAERGAAFNAQHARIVAPGDGVVLQKLAEADELVQAGQPVVAVGSAGRGWVVRVGLADRDVVRLRRGDAARVEFDAWPGQSFTAAVGNIASAADPATGTFTVEIPMQAERAAFVQGLVAKVTLEPRDAPRGIVVPVQALIEANGDEAGVFVLDAERRRVHRVTIRIGRINGAEVEVLGGVAPGTEVVIDGAAFLQNSEVVRVLATGAGPAAHAG